MQALQFGSVEMDAAEGGSVMAGLDQTLLAKVRALEHECTVCSRALVLRFLAPVLVHAAIHCLWLLCVASGGADTRRLPQFSHGYQ